MQSILIDAHPDIDGLQIHDHHLSIFLSCSFKVVLDVKNEFRIKSKQKEAISCQ